MILAITKLTNKKIFCGLLRMFFNYKIAYA